MKITVVSDLHLEFCELALKTDADVLVLSGDILLAEVLYDFPDDYPTTPVVSGRHRQAIRFRNFLKSCSENYKQVIYVAGNHEYYHGKWYKTLDILRDECCLYPNIHFLENNTFEFENVLFVGSTLWSDFNKRDPLTMMTCSGPNGLNDFKIIRNEFNSYHKLRGIDVLNRHQQSIDYLESIISNAPKDKSIVVVTHHAPSFESISEQYKTEHELNGAYASDLSRFILDHPNIVLWTHGHIHSISDYHIGNTRVVCNPRGYVNSYGAEMTYWNPNLVIEI